MERNHNSLEVLIYIPKNNQQEIKYTLHCLFKVFLGIDYTTILRVDKNVKIVIGEKSIEIENSFFVEDDITKLYTVGNIPNEVIKGNINIGNKAFPIVSLYGLPEVSVIDNKHILHTDVISSCFFMLSRWEEYIIKDRDSHNRFPASLSLAKNENFLHRAVVNEYVELIWGLLKEAGFSGKRKERKFDIVPTHDVDSPYLWWSLKDKVYTVAKNIYHRKFIDAWVYFKQFVQGKDPYDTHGLFMEMSEKIDVKSNFFFMSGGNTQFDNRYKIDHPRIVNLIEEVKRRGHKIGLHPSYNSYNNPTFLNNEKDLLSEVSNHKIEIGRHHYLRFEVPLTWRIWNDAGMKWDSTLSYADCAGFRTGVCYPYPVYDILNREMLHLYERPLIIMEGTLVGYEDLSPSAAKLRIILLKEEVKKYNGEFVFLWHNSSFGGDIWRDYEPLLTELYKTN